MVIFRKMVIIGGAILLCSVSLLRNANAASDDFTKICNAWKSTYIFDLPAPSAYMETVIPSGTTETRLYFSNGSYFKLILWGTSEQERRIKDLARLAFTYGYPVSICADATTSPDTILMLAVHNSSGSQVLKKQARDR